jgi:hypothetical protein
LRSHPDLTEQYEQLRREAIIRSGHGSEGLGLALFLRPWNDGVDAGPGHNALIVSHRTHIPNQQRPQPFRLIYGRRSPRCWPESFSVFNRRQPVNGTAHEKVNAGHLRRNAYLYIRQSTLRQVFENTESTIQQYDLRQRAVALGWPVERIVVIDSDLGQSAVTAADREGFQKLVTEVSLEKAGIVLGLELSRLARNSADWRRLLEICALTNTLILDVDGLYDPRHFNDRLLLGLKGTMSEAELVLP